MRPDLIYDGYLPKLKARAWSREMSALTASMTSTVGFCLKTV